ncbi:MAG: helix-turn-helix transcriptional regulator [Trichococcus flocculiformis]|uniref:Helix-turn-helix transcriptional regulator n=1 Tax=Trichococcus flocculiformis TaxID=82803 RepID=A0A847D6S7_9LACT|nr:helix-turn-helix transcriptional regulator [Trichococcus flocculiformis]NLD32280.1 helix-turn-helix transcriptional regulator [Trichococcus flocculiformis]
MDQLANMRKAIGYTQRDMAKEFGISVQAYYRKEKGYTPFTDEEKVIFRDLVKSMFPFVTIDSLFFSENAKKYKVENFPGQDQIEGDGDERGK